MSRRLSTTRLPLLAIVVSAAIASPALLAGCGDSAAPGGDGAVTGGDSGGGARLDSGGGGGNGDSGGGGGQLDGGGGGQTDSAGGGRADSGGGGQADSGGGSGTSKATVKLRTSGCAASFSGTNHVIVRGTTLTISSVAGGLTASLQLVLKQTSGTITLSSKHRQQTGTVINLVTGGTTYSNLTFDSKVYIGQATDPIKGTITIHKLDFASGVSDLTFSGVTLENVGPAHDHCTLDGTVKTSGKSF